MPTTNPVLGEFVEKEGRLYFIKAEHLTTVHNKNPSPVIAGQSGTRSKAGYAYLWGYCMAVAVLIPVLCVMVLFPMLLFGLLIGLGLLKYIGGP